MPTDVIVTDVSDDVDNYTLDSHGFQYYNNVAEEKEFTDEATIVDSYYAECEQLLQHV